MVCFICSCSGSGFCSNFLSFIISITFSFHVCGVLSPNWMCNGQGCEPSGLYYTCADTLCKLEVTDSKVLVLVLIIVVSNLALNVLFCLILNCSHYRYQSLSPTVALGIGSWYIVQETLSVTIIILLTVNYDKTGWSAYVFLVPGISLMSIVIFMLVYMLCFPEKAVYPS